MYTYLQGKSDLPAIAKVSHVLLLKLLITRFAAPSRITRYHSRTQKEILVSIIKQNF